MSRATKGPAEIEMLRLRDRPSVLIDFKSLRISAGLYQNKCREVKCIFSSKGHSW